MDLTIADLLTVPGLAVAVGLLVQAAKLVGLPGKYARAAAILFGVAGALTATGLTDLTVGAMLLAPLLGISAALAAIAGFDVLTSGGSYDVYPADTDRGV